MGQWNYSYDNLNRLIGAVAPTAQPAGVSAYYQGVGVGSGAQPTWTYDPFGNRTTETWAGSGTASMPTSSTNFYTAASNQVSSSTLGALTYDQAGDVIGDGLNSYLYDAEGRLCAVKNSANLITGYIYDAGGRRVAKATLGSLSCNFASNGFPSTTNWTGTSWALSHSGDQVTEYSVSSGTGGWIHTNVFADGKLLATYRDTTTYFALNDWLGTKRVEVGTSGCASMFTGLPFGNGLPPTTQALTGYSACVDATEQHFTGKERDTESGNDYFGARYYASTMGRWLSPDTDMTLKRILPNPQRWNRYAYVINNPLVLVDPNGLWDIYVFRPEAKNNAGWGGVIRDAKANGNTIHMFNATSDPAATRAAYLDALKNGDAKVVFVGHSVDDATGKAGSLLFTGNQAVGKLSPFVNPDGTGGTVPAVATPGNIDAQSVGAFACTSDTLSGQYSSTDFSGLSGLVFDRTADAGGAAYADVLAKDGSTADADAAAQKAMDRTQATINPSDGKPAGPAPKVKEHPNDN